MPGRGERSPLAGGGAVPAASPPPAWQSLGNLDGVSYRDRTTAIAGSWRAATEPLAAARSLLHLYKITLIHVLQEDWARAEEASREELINEIQNCTKAITCSNLLTGNETKFDYLIKTSRDPWHHPVLKSIMQDTQPDSQRVLSWLREEGCTGAFERLRQLCVAGGSCEKAALRLALALAPLPSAGRILSAHFHYRVLDALLVLLLRARRTTECIAYIKSMEMNEAVSLIGRLVNKNKSHGRVWKSAHDTALLCTQVLVATCLVQPLKENHLGTLATRLASLYAPRTDELAPALRKLLHSADTAAHIYIVCRAVQHHFGEQMRPFVCELYLRALTTGMNELERLKLQDETGTTVTSTAHELADWFLSLADLLSPNKIISAECVLTAFSLHPSKQYYKRVEECSILLQKNTVKCEKFETEQRYDVNDPFAEALSGLENDLKNILRNEAKLHEQPMNLVSSAVLEAEGLGLSSDLCHDLVVLLSGPRLKMLTWDLAWRDLSEHCLSYMADTEEGTKALTKELKYVHLDYSQFTLKEPEVHDVYFGIEKGYEHHLEIDDEWDESENDIQLQDYSESLNNSSDSACEDSNRKQLKKSKKKSSKKINKTDLEDKQLPNKYTEKKQCEEKCKSKSKRKNLLNNSSLNTSNSDNQITLGNEFKNPQKCNNLPLHKPHENKPGVHNVTENQNKSLLSPFRLQMDAYEAQKNAILNQLLKNQNKCVENNIEKYSWGPMSQQNDYRNSSHVECKSNLTTMKTNYLNANTSSGISNNCNTSQTTLNKNCDISHSPFTRPKSSLLLFRKNNMKHVSNNTTQEQHHLQLDHKNQELKYCLQNTNTFEQHISSHVPFENVTSSYKNYEVPPNYSLDYKDQYACSSGKVNERSSPNVFSLQNTTPEYDKSLYNTPNCSSQNFNNNFINSTKKSMLDELSLLRSRLKSLEGQSQISKTIYSNTTDHLSKSGSISNDPYSFQDEDERLKNTEPKSIKSNNHTSFNRPVKMSVIENVSQKHIRCNENSEIYSNRIIKPNFIPSDNVNSNLANISVDVIRKGNAYPNRQIVEFPTKMHDSQSLSQNIYVSNNSVITCGKTNVNSIENSLNDRNFSLNSFQELNYIEREENEVTNMQCNNRKLFNSVFNCDQVQNNIVNTGLNTRQIQNKQYINQDVSSVILSENGLKKNVYNSSLYVENKPNIYMKNNVAEKQCQTLPSDISKIIYNEPEKLLSSNTRKTLPCEHTTYNEKQQNLNTVFEFDKKYSESVKRNTFIDKIPNKTDVISKNISKADNIHTKNMPNNEYSVFIKDLYESVNAGSDKHFSNVNKTELQTTINAGTYFIDDKTIFTETVNQKSTSQETENPGSRKKESLLISMLNKKSNDNDCLTRITKKQFSNDSNCNRIKMSTACIPVETTYKNNMFVEHIDNTKSKPMHIDKVNDKKFTEGQTSRCNTIEKNNQTNSFVSEVNSCNRIQKNKTTDMSNSPKKIAHTSNHVVLQETKKADEIRSPRIDSIDIHEKDSYVISPVYNSCINSADYPSLNVPEGPKLKMNKSVSVKEVSPQNASNQEQNSKIPKKANPKTSGNKIKNVKLPQCKANRIRENSVICTNPITIKRCDLLNVTIDKHAVISKPIDKIKTNEKRKPNIIRKKQSEENISALINKISEMKDLTVISPKNMPKSLTKAVTPPEELKKNSKKILKIPPGFQGIANKDISLFSTSNTQNKSVSPKKAIIVNEDHISSKNNKCDESKNIGGSYDNHSIKSDISVIVNKNFTTRKWSKNAIDSVQNYECLAENSVNHSSVGSKEENDKNDCSEIDTNCFKTCEAPKDIKDLLLIHDYPAENSVNHSSVDSKEDIRYKGDKNDLSEIDTNCLNTCDAPKSIEDSSLNHDCPAEDSINHSLVDSKDEGDKNDLRKIDANFLNMFEAPKDIEDSIQKHDYHVENSVNHSLVDSKEESNKNDLSEIDTNSLNMCEDPKTIEDSLQNHDCHIENSVNQSSVDSKKESNKNDISEIDTNSLNTCEEPKTTEDSLQNHDYPAENSVNRPSVDSKEENDKNTSCNIHNDNVFIEEGPENENIDESKKENLNTVSCLKQSENENIITEKLIDYSDNKSNVEVVITCEGSGDELSLPNTIHDTSVIDLLSSDSDSSDVEIVMSGDPIAVDTQVQHSDPFPNKGVKSNSVPEFLITKKLPPPPTFVTVFSTVRSNALNKKKSMRNLSINLKSGPKSTCLVDNETLKIIKTPYITEEDKKRLQMPCCVRLKRSNLLRLKNDDGIRRKQIYKKRYESKKPVKSVAISTSKHDNVKKSHKLPTQNSTFCQQSNSYEEFKLKPFSIVLLDVEKEKNKCDKGKKSNICNSNLNYRITGDCGKIDTIKVGHNLNSSTNCDDINILNEKFTKEDEQKVLRPDIVNNRDEELNNVKLEVQPNTNNVLLNNIKPDILSDDIFDESDLGTNQHDITMNSSHSDNKTNVLSSKDVSKTTCPDLITKINMKIRNSTSPKPDIISNISDINNDKIIEQYVDEHIKCDNNEINTSLCVDKNSFQNNLDEESAFIENTPEFNSSKDIIKTYQNKLSKNKRKMDLNFVKVKRIKSDFHIDLPEITESDIERIRHTSDIMERQFFKYATPFNVKYLLSKDADSSGITNETCGHVHETETNFDFGPDIELQSKIENNDTVEDSRDSFYSPIFSDYDIDVYEKNIQRIHDLSENFESIHNHHSNKNELDNDTKRCGKQGKGFGDWSDRGNTKDSLRGRQEGPAAVLSDTFTNRPPLALHNFTQNKHNELNVSTYFAGKNAYNSNSSDNELNNNNLQKVLKNIKNSKTYSNENIFNSKHISEELKSHFEVTKYKECAVKRNCKLSNKYSSLNVLSRVPGLDNLDFVRPLQSTSIVNVVQLGQLPSTSNQQENNITTSTIAQTMSNSDTSSSVDQAIITDEISTSSSTVDNIATEYKENDIEKINTSCSLNANNSANENSENINIPIKVIENDAPCNNRQVSNEIHTLSSSNVINLQEDVSEKALNHEIQPTLTQVTHSENLQIESKENCVSNSTVDNQINVMPTNTTNYMSSNRSQTLVNLLSQKIINSPITSQQVQMGSFHKGTTINALSLQQALAQILPPPLSQASSESVIHSTSHSSTPQVVHIVGKNTQSNNTFNSILVDSSQPVINAPGSTQVLHIVQGKSTQNPGNSILNQSQMSTTTFSGLSLVDTGNQHPGNQVLHIVNAGMPNKNTTTQVLKRVNLLTSITNSQGNNEQKMVQFVCKSADGKAIQLNTQPQRGMVLRLQPIDGSAFSQNQKTESLTTINTTSVVQSNIKSQTEQAQELKSRSMYEENYAKFIQNNSSNPPLSPEKSVSLPKFNQAFGKSVFQENSIQKTSENLDEVQNTVTVANEQSTPTDNLTTLNLGQLGHINNSPLLIRKTPQSNIIHQNVQTKQTSAPVNIQTIQGSVIYTRQIPVNIGGTQTINLITVPSNDLIDESQLQVIQKQNQEKSITADQQIESQVIKLVPSEQQQSSNTVCQVETSDDNQSFTDQTQSNSNSHPLLTQMRIKVPMLSKNSGQMVTGTRVVRPVLQIQRNLIPGSNPAVYQQLVLTTTPTLRQPISTPTANVRPTRVSNLQQESTLSSSTLEQLREFDMVLEQVKERSTVQPVGNSTSNFSESSSQVIDNEIDSTQTDGSHISTQREVLYSIGTNQTVNVAYVNQKLMSKTSYVTSDSSVNVSQNSPSNQNIHTLTNTISHSKPGCNTPTKVSSKTIKNKSSKPTNPSTSNISKSSPIATKTSLQKPLEDEQTTQRILYILAEYKEQVENSPDKDKPAPRRRSNPPTNPTASTKRKKSSSGSTKKTSSGQSLQEMSPLGGEDAGHTMGSEDSSCGLSQGECTDNSIQGPENQSPQSSPQKIAKKSLYQQDTDLSTPITQHQRNVIIADTQTISMTRPNTGKTTAVLMPANYLLPMSMVKGSQQITIVTNQGSKILSVPHGEGGTTNALFVQRLISPAGLKPMLTRPGQVRHVRLPTNTVQNLQTFNLNSSNITQESSWLGNNLSNNTHSKILTECNSNTISIHSDTMDSDISTPQTVKNDKSLISDNSIKIESSVDGTDSKTRENLDVSNSHDVLNQTQNTQELSLHDMSEQILHRENIDKTNNPLNLIQVHQMNTDSEKLFVQESSNVDPMIQLPNKTVPFDNDDKNADVEVHNSAQNLTLNKHSQLSGQYLNSNKTNSSNCDETEQSNGNEKFSPSGATVLQQTYIVTSCGQQKDTSHKSPTNENHISWSSTKSGAITNSNEHSSFVDYENSPRRLSSQEEAQDTDTHDCNQIKELSENTTRILRHPYSPSSSPPGPRHFYHKMFISTPIKKTFVNDIVDNSTSSVDEDKQYGEHDIKKSADKSSLVPTASIHPSNTSYTIHHHNASNASVRNAEVKTTASLTDVSEKVINTSIHSAISLRHKYAVMEHELRLQKSLSEECEDLGVDSPSASDLFPEAELLFAASPSSQFDQSQDGCILTSTNHASPTIHITNSNVASLPTTQTVTSLSREPRLLGVQNVEVAGESEFARMHPNTTFHTGEIELVGDNANDTTVNISFRSSAKSLAGTQLSTKTGDVIHSIIEGIGNNSVNTSFQAGKMQTRFSMVELPQHPVNVISSLQSSDDYSEGAEDSMNSNESKDCLINNKTLEGMLSNEIVKRDINLSSTESPVCVSSGIIQRNVSQVIKHASSDQIVLSGSSSSEKCALDISDLNKSNHNFLVENNSGVRTPVESVMLKSVVDRDARDSSSPEQHSELFWESNSNSNQSEEQTPHIHTNLLDFSSEDSNKCCKSPISCEETNSTDSSSLGRNIHLQNLHPLRINSVIKSSGVNSSAVDGPILHSALLSGTLNTNQDVSNKVPLTLNTLVKSNSNTSSSSEENEHKSNRGWDNILKNSVGRTIVSPHSLSTEINIGAEIETSSPEGVPILAKTKGMSNIHSDSSTPEEGSSNNSRRTSLRGPGGVKRSCHCCSGTLTTAQMSTNSTTRRARRKPSLLH